MANEISSQTQPITERELIIGDTELVVRETADFPYDDPWSELTRKVIEDLRESGALDGRDFLEAGIGDGRNALLALDLGAGGAQRLTGIELDDWRLELAEANLKTAGIDAGRVALHNSDIVSWLEGSTRQIDGWSLACLPQAPREATENDADGYVDSDSLQPYHGQKLGEHDVDTYGLTLNAAFLSALRHRVNPLDFNALVTLSDRVPPAVLEELFDQTGWGVVDVRGTAEPIQQDPDTGIDWIVDFDDGERFQEKAPYGRFVPITAEIAEARRRNGLEEFGDKARDELNVYHGLSVYHLQPQSKAPWL